MDLMSRHLAAAGEPLPIELPPLPEGGPDMSPDRLHELAALYFQAELEQGEVIAVAEALAINRLRIDIRSVSAARKLEVYARLQRDWFSPSDRLDTFARLFGLNPGTKTNDDFQRLFANVCASLQRYAQQFDFGRPPRPTDEAILRQAVRWLLMNLGEHATGQAIYSGQRIGRQLQQSIELLTEPGIQEHFLTRNLWETLGAVLGPSTPDFTRITARAQAGTRVLHWLADAMFRFRDQRSALPLVPAGDAVLVWAVQWLQATGLAPSTQTPLWKGY